MTDILTAEKRSWNMSRIRGKDTKPEKLVRSLLYRMGYRFRIHVKNLPGTPDIVLKKYKTVIFVHGCFWHRHNKCKYAYVPKSRKEFWEKKFSDNVKRHEKVERQLLGLGWKVHVVWECELKDFDVLRQRLSKIINNKVV